MKQQLSMLTSIAAMALIPGCLDSDSGLTKNQVSQILEIQQETQQERSSLSRQRDDLEQDRRAWAERERQDPIIATSIYNGALIVACCLPLAMIILLLAPINREPSVELICETLIDETSPDQPKQNTIEKQNRRLH
ncbi:hypothetical protein [Rhodopirellula sp. MGV]|uniref:hypothetical protein n=1 Tax=Rhodopirellula sp. MGV TaxID=2023130 RepID=UPI000B966EF9|nr:hypothetical protein [Rhodopirellula sp. MGV]OYP33981.1 hypothetical protein CGZ80_17560 [Rhodopirellula sp. MGV]